MMKKLFALVGAGAMLLSAVGPAFAKPPMPPKGGGGDVAIIDNHAEAQSSTGNNSQSNVADVTKGGGVDVYGADGDRTMYTGDAKAYAGGVVVANTHVGCGKCGGGKHHEEDLAIVANDAIAGARSGDNGQDDLALVTNGGGVTVDGGKGDRYLKSGDAKAESHAWTVVNTHWGY